MKDILAKICEILCNPSTRDEMRQHMQALLHEFSLAKDEKELEKPCSKTLDSLSLQQEEDDEGISMMHASLDDIDRDMARAKLYKGRQCLQIARWHFNQDGHIGHQDHDACDKQLAL